MEPKITEKAWEPKLEDEILKKWEDERLYDFKLQDENYTIDTPHHILQEDHGILVQHPIMLR